MTFVLVSEGPGRLRVARVISESRRDVGRDKNVRILTCRFANDEISRSAESKPFKVYPTQVLAEYQDDHETNDVHLDYRAALRPLATVWVHRRIDGEDLSKAQRDTQEKRADV